MQLLWKYLNIAAVVVFLLSAIFIGAMLQKGFETMDTQENLNAYCRGAGWEQAEKWERRDGKFYVLCTRVKKITGHEWMYAEL